MKRLLAISMMAFFPVMVCAEDAKNLLKPVNKAESWRLEQHDGAEATLKIADDAAVINATKLTATNWHIQAFQVDLDLQEGKEYTLKLKLAASQRRNLLLVSGAPRAETLSFSAPAPVTMSGSSAPFLGKYPRENPMQRRTFPSLVVASVLGVSSLGAIAMAAEGKLKVGDPAPPLAVSTWLHGPEVKGFEPGRVYVVEFWATWCGPCRQIMPHMGDLQDEYREKAVTFIGFASEANDKEAKVNAFVAKHGAKLGYTFAFGSGTETHNAYMKASGQNGIPCSFVVDKHAKIAYIGHPLFLDIVLPKVLDGTWDQKIGADTLAAADKDFDAAYAVVMKTNSAEDGLQALAKFAAKWPALADNVYMIQAKLGLLVRGKHFTEAKELAEKLIAKGVARGGTSGLRSVSTALREDSTKGHADLTALAKTAAEAAYGLDPENPAIVLDLLDVYAFTGDQTKVKEFGPKAVAAAKAALEGENDAIGTIAVAAAYFASGDKAQAKATAEKAIKIVDRKDYGLLRYVERQAKKYGVEPEKHQSKSDR